jgi:predicted MFS family arabinose efflux permease
MKGDDSRQAPAFRRLKLPWAMVILILVLTGAIWIFFYLEDMALDSGATSVVALVVIILVVTGRWLLKRARRKGVTK